MLHWSAPLSSCECAISEGPTYGQNKGTVSAELRLKTPLNQ